MTRWLPDFRPKLRDGSAPDITLRHCSPTPRACATARSFADDPYVIAKVSGGLDVPGLEPRREPARGSRRSPLEFAPGTRLALLAGDRCSRRGDRQGARRRSRQRGQRNSSPARSACATRSSTSSTSEAPCRPLRGRHAAARPHGRAARSSEPIRRGHCCSRRGAHSIRNPTSPAAPVSNGTAGDFAIFLDALQQRRRADPEAGDARDGEPQPYRRPAARGEGCGLAFRPDLGRARRSGRRQRARCRTGSLEWGGAWGHRWLVDPRCGDLRGRPHQHRGRRRRRRLSEG